MDRRRTSRTLSLMLASILAVVASGCGSVAKPATGGAAGGTAAGAGVSKASAPQKVSIVEIVNAPSVSAPGIIALSKGYFKAEGIKADFIRGGGGAQVDMLMGSGSAQFGVMGASDMPYASKLPFHPMAVLPTRVGVTYRFVVRSGVAKQRGIKPGLPLKETLTKLKGLPIVGSSAKGESTLVMNYVLQLNGFQPKGFFRWVYAGGPNTRASAFFSGSADIIALANAVDVRRVMSGGKATRVFNTGTIPPFKSMYSVVLIATQKMVSTEPGTVQKVVTAFRRALDFLYQHPHQSESIVEHFYARKIPAKLVAASFEADVVPSLPRKAQAALGYRMSQAQWQSIDKMDVATGVVKKAPSPRQGVMWTNRFVKTGQGS